MGGGLPCDNVFFQLSSVATKKEKGDRHFMLNRVQHGVTINNFMIDHPALLETNH
jgi:hypothetical protein